MRIRYIYGVVWHSTVYQASLKAVAAADAANDDEIEFDVIALHPEHLLLSNINWGR